MPSYRAYGLQIDSELVLPELVAGEGEAEVTIRFGAVTGSRAETAGRGWAFHATPEGVVLSWSGVGAFLVRDGREIVMDPLPGVEERVLRLFLLGTTLAVLLHQRGWVVLHGSVVASAGRALAFVGPKQAGKSTIAALLHGRQYDLLADDVVAIDLSQGDPLALSGFPQMKLWPDSIEAVGLAAEALPRLRAELEKRSYRVAHGFSQHPVPLRCIYTLSRGPRLKIERLRPAEALKALMPHWYGARYGMELLRALGLVAFFRQCTSLASTVAICRLERPTSLSDLPEVARLIDAHLAGDLSQVGA